MYTMAYSAKNKVANRIDVANGEKIHVSVVPSSTCITMASIVMIGWVVHMTRFVKMMLMKNEIHTHTL